MPLVQKGNSGQIHNGRFCNQVCVHSLHTSGIQDLGEPHDPSSPSNPFSNPDVPSEEIDDPGQDDMILHQDLIQPLNLLECKGNGDRFLLIRLMLYQRQRLR